MSMVPPMHILFSCVMSSGAMPGSTLLHRYSYRPNATLPTKYVSTPLDASHSLDGTVVLMTFAFRQMPLRQTFELLLHKVEQF